MITKPGIPAVLLGLALAAHSSASRAEGPWSPIGYLVVGSFKSYAGATKHVEMLQARTGVHVDLRNLTFSKGVLSLEEDDCEHNGTAWSATECWVPRGRTDSFDVSLSIERSDWYPPMKPGYYVVVAAIGGAEELAAAREALRPAKVESYFTYVPTYFGCSR